MLQLEYLEPVWALLIQAPWAFSTLALFLIASGWGAGRFMFAERLETLKSRVEHRDETIARLMGKKMAMYKVERFDTGPSEFELSSEPTDPTAMIVVMGGVYQMDYSLSGRTISFGEPTPFIEGGLMVKYL